MNTKSFGLVILLSGLLLLNSCSGLSPKQYEKFPPGADFEKVLKAMERTMKANPRFYEIKGIFKITSPKTYPPTYMEVVYIPEKNKDTFYEYSYDMVDAHWAGPRQVTLHEGTTSGRQLDRDEFESVLFEPTDMPDFSLFDNMYEKALETADMGEDGHVAGFDMNRFDGNNNFFITISTKDGKTKKAIFFDKTGDVLGVKDL